jgi:putative sterol carrier protein
MLLMPISIDVRKYFNVDLPAALTAHAAEARAVGVRYQFVIQGPDGGDWNVDLTDNGPICKFGKGPADCTITLSDANFRSVCEQANLSVALTRLFMTGKVKVDGKLPLALKLDKILAFVQLPKSAASPPSKPAEAAPKSAAR